MIDLSMLSDLVPIIAFFTSGLSFLFVMVLAFKHRNLVKMYGLLDAQLHKTKGDLTALTGSLAGVGQRVLAIENLIAKAFHKTMTQEAQSMPMPSQGVNHYQPTSVEITQEPILKERALTKAEAQLSKLLQPKTPLAEGEATVTDPNQ